MTILSDTMKNISPVLLIILDGFGLADADPALKNAIKEAKTPNLDRFFKEFPSSIIETSGKYVGLPDNQMGNSEIGHMNIAAGRIVYSDMVRIHRFLDNKELKQNENFRKFMTRLSRTDQVQRSLHIMGLLSDGGVHSHIKHLEKILKVCREEYPQVKIYLHAFLDGRDTPPRSGVSYVKEILNYISALQNIELATIIGRYFAMDRDKRWERIRKAYDLLVKGIGKKSQDPLETLKEYYKKNITDEFMEPILVNSSGLIRSQDGVFFFNFRSDRARQLTAALTKTKDLSFGGKSDIDFLCLTEYDEKLDLPVIFEPLRLTNLLGEVVSKHSLSQLRLAETEKYAHVTFFFNGGVERPFPKEDRILIPSPKVATYDLRPEMSAYQIKDKLLEVIDSQKYPFILVNFANGDMVGHTGNFEAAVKAVEVLDECLGEISQKSLENQYQMFITADHGNCEQMLSKDRETPFTQHTTAAVPLLLISPPTGERKNRTLKNGKLADIAPTILEAMGIQAPPEMKGDDLLS